MSTQDYIHFSQSYTTNLQSLLQFQGGKLADKVTTANYTGKAAKAVEQFGKAVPTRNLSRHADTPLTSTPADARWVFPQRYTWADIIDDYDKVRMLVDLQSPYLQNGLNALRRAQDDEILANFFASAQTGENGSTATTFPAGNIVAVNTGGTSSALNVAKLRAARKLLMAAAVDLANDPLYIAVNSTDHDALLNEVQVINLDYNIKPVLVDGMIDRFLGFNFIHVEYTDSSYPLASAALVNGSSQRLCPVWVKSGMHLGIWGEPQGKVDQLPNKNYSTQVFAEGYFGATRLEEGRVVQILCA